MMRKCLRIAAVAMGIVIVTSCVPVWAACPPTTGDQYVVGIYDDMLGEHSPTIRASKNAGVTYGISWAQSGYYTGQGGAFSRLFNTSDHSMSASSTLDTRPSNYQFFGTDLAALFQSGAYEWATTWLSTLMGTPSTFFPFFRLLESNFNPLMMTETQAFSRQIGQGISTAVAPMQNSGGFGTVFMYFDVTSWTARVVCRTWDSAGNLTGDRYLQSWTPSVGEMVDHVAVSGFTSGTADRLVASWTTRDYATSVMTVFYQVVDQTCWGVSPILVAGSVANSAVGHSGYPAVAAFSSGFMLTWVGTASDAKDEIYYRTFNTAGSPYGSAVVIDSSSHQNGRGKVRVSGAYWGPTGGVAANYSLITWVRLGTDGLEYPEMKLLKGLFPAFGASSVQSITSPGGGSNGGGFEDRGFSVDLFTGCRFDLRAGITWIYDLNQNPDWGYLMKRFYAFVPTGSAMSGQVPLVGFLDAEPAGATSIASPTDDDSESDLLAPGILIDVPQDFDTPVMPSPGSGAIGL